MEMKVSALEKGAVSTHSNIATNDNGRCYGSDAAGVLTSETNVHTAYITTVPGGKHTATKQQHRTMIGNTGTCPADDKNSSETNPTLKHTLHVICQASNFQSSTQPRTTSEEGPTLASDGDMQNIARFLLFLPAEIAAIPMEEQATKIQEKIKSVYGDKNGEFKKNYLQPLQEKQLTFKLGSNQESKSINAVAQGSDAEIVLSYFLCQQYDRNQRKRANTTSPTKENFSKKSDSEDKTEEKKDEVIKQPQLGAKPLKQTNVTKRNVLGTKNECKVKKGTVIISAVIKASLLFAFLLL
uniref:Variant surface glycoprotein 1125.5493 n=1 Tax=Trypanosoma brucei TaxID=5691 RepID=A0A1J0RCS6_9TRYP|nr:variant surface glycoprotein 1125.5493 [Trypanosoma brucei]